MIKKMQYQIEKINKTQVMKYVLKINIYKFFFFFVDRYVSINGTYQQINFIKTNKIRDMTYIHNVLIKWKSLTPIHQEACQVSS